MKARYKFIRVKEVEERLKTRSILRIIADDLIKKSQGGKKDVTANDCNNRVRVKLGGKR